jgi:Domain of unknown function (DU1801)
MTAPPPALLELLYRHEPVVRSLTLGLRYVVLDEMAPCHEYVFSMGPRVVLLYGPTEKVIKDGVCLVSVFLRHVNLGFFHGADLSDPSGILKGTGKGMRHFSLKQLPDLGRPEIRAYIREARTRAGLKRPRQRTTASVVTRFKVKSPAKRPGWPQMPW